MKRSALKRVHGAKLITAKKNKLQWDLMPGASMTRHYGVDEKTAYAFTYSIKNGMVLIE